MFTATAEARSVKKLSAPSQPLAAPSTRTQLITSKAANKKEGKQSKPNKKDKAEKNVKMAATGVNDCSLKDVSHPSCSEQLRAYNTATFKLVKTGKTRFLNYIFHSLVRIVRLVLAKGIPDWKGEKKKKKEERN